MDDALFHSNVALGAPIDSSMELDYMDELLLEGCWLEATDGSNFFNQTPSSAFFDASYTWPMLEGGGNEKPGASPPFRIAQEERETLELAENPSVFDLQVGALVNKSNGHGLVGVANGLNQSEKFFQEGSELSKLLWIAPRVNPSASSVMERLMRALNYLRDSSRSGDALIQIWVPVNKGNARVLTTIDQPFSINSSSQQLADYRNISVKYQFAAQEDFSVSTGLPVGLPGRVFSGKVPEWTPDVRFFRVDEYPRVSYAQQCDVRGTLALPVFEQGSRMCLGVIEVVMITQKVNYRAELESVCRALEAVDLRSSELSSPQKAKEYSSSYQAALPEILEVLKSACGSHGLPLAQTWVQCVLQGKEGCRHSDENLTQCVSTVDSACFVADPSMQGFHEACSEHHILKGQGVAGKAFMTNQPCFSPDITTYSKTEYPLSHHARMFGLCAAVAIRLRSIYTGDADFVLEFFLPTGCRDPEEQKRLLSSLSMIIQRVCRSLRVVTDKELQQEILVPNSKVTVISDDGGKFLSVENNGSGSSSQEESSEDAARERCAVPPCSQEDKLRESLGGEHLKNRGHDSSAKGSPGCSGDYSAGGVGSLINSGKSGEKKRAKAERTINLEVLRQHFAGSLKDAAKNIGVCPTTLKRICRQHGIKRWPSRKIKKVGHSLQKLQVVIDSVQGASGSFQIGSFYSNFPDLASPNVSGTSPFSTSKQTEAEAPQKSPNQELTEVRPVSPQTATSKSPSSSCSQSSSSSQCYSSGTNQTPFAWNASSNEDPPPGGINSHDQGGLKRARSEAELHAPICEESELISRSQSQKSLVENVVNNDNKPPLPRHCGGQAIQEGDSWRVKVEHGEEKIRFRMLKGWGFKDLVQEVMRRFNVGSANGFHIKYLDDDSEWVLLTCDADLEECIDICRSTQRQTIRLSLQASHSHPRSSVGSNDKL